MAPRKATLSRSVPVGSGIWGKRGWSVVGAGEEGIIDCGVGVTSHTIRAHTHNKPQRRRMIRAEAGGTVTYLTVSRAHDVAIDCLRKICQIRALYRMIIKRYHDEPATERELLCLMSDVVRGGDPRQLPSISPVVLPLHFLTDILLHRKPVHA
jgi:hypothetical protein